ncbi:RNase HI [Syntrophobotulus glycolicus DSM 8271]|uniref:Ribonuclease H n=1 Tax=Syntrophobotulus glycolicus (strain DSM 8271 / FlGlyR) TaxID=645991 RepID=F0STW1_SYNGF|nr:ribonuclease HI [Syntrophobotulus glycolicus]ADY56484.1 RNase HI [Syntrophobotulus glycolicus DSM 8271]
MKKTVDIYTDGACSGNPGPGGWAAVLKYGETIKEISGFSRDSTNQVMELTAVIEALERLSEPCAVRLFSDSAYVINAFRQNWLEKWQKNGWLNTAKKPVANQDLWKRLLQVVNKHELEWIKVKGHSDNFYNNRCDFLARKAIESNILP